MNIQGKKVLLRAIEEYDLELLHKWSNDPDITSMLGGWHFPSSMQDQAKWFHDQNHNSLNQRFIIETKEYDQIGMINLVGINWKDRRAVTGIYLRKEDIRGKGYAKDAIQTINRYAFEELGFMRLDSMILDCNESSKRVYLEKCGWKIEGKKEKACFRKGCWLDELIIGITLDDYIQFKKEQEK